MKHIRKFFEGKKIEEVRWPAEPTQPWYEPEDCEDCLIEAEKSGIEYERNFTWKEDFWYCDSCGRIL
jgi:hypothetical protein